MVVWRGVVWRGVVCRGVVWRGVVWRGVPEVLLPNSNGRDVLHAGNAKREGCVWCVRHLQQGAIVYTAVLGTPCRPLAQLKRILQHTATMQVAVGSG